MSTYAATAAFTMGTNFSVSSEDLESTAMTITLVEVREPIWITLTEVSN